MYSIKGLAVILYIYSDAQVITTMEGMFKHLYLP